MHEEENGRGELSGEEQWSGGGRVVGSDGNWEVEGMFDDDGADWICIALRILLPMTFDGEDEWAKNGFYPKKIRKMIWNTAGETSNIILEEHGFFNFNILGKD